MVFSTLFTSTTVNVFRTFVHFGHRRGFNGYFTGMIGAAGLLTLVSATGSEETHESRSSSSDFYKENFGAKYDDPIEKLPAFENGWHSNHAHGVQKKYAGGH